MVRIDITENFYRVRIREPRIFTEFRIPQWAGRIADKICSGSKVAMGRKGKEWKVQSILIPRKQVKTKRQALKYAKQIFRKIEQTKGLVW